MTTEEDEVMKQLWKEAHEGMAEWNAEIQKSFAGILESIGGTAKEDFEELMDGCDLNGKGEIVTKPGGSANNESFGIFTEIFCDQWSIGDSGDCFEGYLYAKFDTDKWLKIPYSC